MAAVVSSSMSQLSKHASLFAGRRWRRSSAASADRRHGRQGVCRPGRGGAADAAQRRHLRASCLLLVAAVCPSTRVRRNGGGGRVARKHRVFNVAHREQLRLQSPKSRGRGRGAAAAKPRLRPRALCADLQLARLRAGGGCRRKSRIACCPQPVTSRQSPVASRQPTEPSSRAQRGR